MAAMLMQFVTASALVINGGSALAAPRVAPAVTRAPAPSMGLMDFLSNMLYDKQVAQSRSRPGSSKAASSKAVNRLKVILAQDRAGLDDETMNKIRAEIQEVVAKYVTIDTSDIQFQLQSDDRVTLFTASFPMRAGPERRVEVVAGIAEPAEDDEPATLAVDI